MRSKAISRVLRACVGQHSNQYEPQSRFAAIDANRGATAGWKALLVLVSVGSLGIGPIQNAQSSDITSFPAFKLYITSTQNVVPPAIPDNAATAADYTMRDWCLGSVNVGVHNCQMVSVTESSTQWLATWSYQVGSSTFTTGFGNPILTRCLSGYGVSAGTCITSASARADKQFGGCIACQTRNPVNFANRTKYREERDYEGSGPDRKSVV